MKKYRIALILLLLLMFAGRMLAQDKIALAIKSRGQTSLKRHNEKKYKENLKIGTSLFNQDHLKTGKDGYAVLVFLDDKSQIKIRENSEMMIAGSRTTEAISKRISMQIGTLKAEVSPQQKGEFVIATPTSVASVKGTVFWLVSDPIEGDIFYGTSGSIEVTNNQSGALVIVGSNQSATSTPEGELELKETIKVSGSVQTYEEQEITLSNMIIISGGEDVKLSGTFSIDENTTVEGSGIESGAQVTITAEIDKNGLARCVIIEASEDVSELGEYTITGVVDSYTEDVEIVLMKDFYQINPALPSEVDFDGTLIMNDETSIEGGKIEKGLTVIITCKLDAGGIISVEKIKVKVLELDEYTITGVVDSYIEDVEIVLKKDNYQINPALPSGVYFDGTLIMNDETSIEGGKIEKGLTIFITCKLYNNKEFVAINIEVQRKERELIFELENPYGDKKYLHVEY